ncbi:MAG: DUF1932 domain-containing protein [Paracoccus sp. (in: a-proteobacteria)]|nr:DUF1932 domain-containing protein [Paracoccus sp. (in: a-proteobacteria)]
MIPESIPDRMLKIALIGCGEVGLAYARHLLARNVALTVVDPAAPPPDLPLRFERSLPAEPVDVILAPVPLAVSAQVAAQAYASCKGALYIDMSSSPRERMREAAAADWRDDFVDAAIMGSVTLTGAETPMLLAGARAQEAAALLNGLGLVAEALPDSAPGDAGAVKLLRSIITKGLEALAVEAFLTAERIGLSSALKANLDDISAYRFPDFLETLLRTHVLHARRRSAEVAAALDQISSNGADSTVTRAVLARFQRTAGALGETPALPADLAGALAILAAPADA